MTDYKTAVVAIVEHDGKVLVGKEIKSGHFMSNIWHIPGGRIRDGETEAGALIREIREEAGIEIKVKEFLDEKLVPEAKIKAKWYLCHPVTRNLKAGSDLEEVRFVPKSEITKICDQKAISLWPPKVLEYFELKI